MEAVRIFTLLKICFLEKKPLLALNVKCIVSVSLVWIGFESESCWISTTVLEKVVQ